MGTFKVPLDVAALDRRRFVVVEALVDTGAAHTVLPQGMLISLGVEPVERVGLQLAGERVTSTRLDGRERVTLVVFGPEGATPLLGATTLKLFNLAVDPVRQRLVAVPGLLK